MERWWCGVKPMQCRWDAMPCRPVAFISGGLERRSGARSLSFALISSPFSFSRPGVDETMPRSGGSGWRGARAPAQGFYSPSSIMVMADGGSAIRDMCRASRAPRLGLPWVWHIAAVSRHSISKRRRSKAVRVASWHEAAAANVSTAGLQLGRAMHGMNCGRGTHPAVGTVDGGG